MNSAPRGGYDYDWLVIGSGFGGSVSALRLAEKGYRVGVLECGRRFRDRDFARSAWNLRRYLWMPRLGMRGIFRMTLFKDVFIVSGVRGRRREPRLREHPLSRPAGLLRRPPVGGARRSGRRSCVPITTTAERMLGVTEYEGMTPGGRAAQGIRRGDRRRRHVQADAGRRLLRGAGDVRSPDPYFDGEGPPRSGCIRCGSCMVGCRYGAKNTLVKNYLWFAERQGVHDPARAPGHRDPPARRGRRLRRLRGRHLTSRAPGRAVASTR